MSELQAEAAASDDVVANEPQAIESDSAPDTGESQEQKVTFSEEQQAVMDSVIGKKTFQAREAERKTEQLQAQLDEAKANIPQQARPDVPAMPEQFDENYDQLMLDRDDAIRAATQHDANANAQQAVADAQAQQQAAQEQQAVVQKITTYSDNAVKKGIKPEELQVAGNSVSSYGLRQDVTLAMLDDIDGPLVTMYLSKNPLAIDSLNQANAITLGQVYSDIRQKAAALGIKQSTAPAPAETLTGAGAPPGDRGPKGATYE